MRDIAYPRSLAKEYWDSQTDGELKEAIGKESIVKKITRFQSEYDFLSRIHNNNAMPNNRDAVSRTLSYHFDRANNTFYSMSSRLELVLICLHAVLDDYPLGQEARKLVGDAIEEIIDFSKAITAQAADEYIYVTRICHKLHTIVQYPLGRQLNSCSEFRQSLQTLHKTPCLTHLKDALSLGGKIHFFCGYSIQNRR